MVVERLVILIGVAVLLLALLGVWQVYQRRRIAAVAAAETPEALRGFVNGQRPSVLYFTTPECAQCRLQQGPILSQLAARVDVAVHKLDAVEQEGLARFYGIMTVPTTVVLDAELRPLAVNHGVAPLPKLLAQVTGSGV